MDGEGNVTTTAYDARSRLISQTDTFGRKPHPGARRPRPHHERHPGGRFRLVGDGDDRPDLLPRRAGAHGDERSRPHDDVHAGRTEPCDGDVRHPRLHDGDDLRRQLEREDAEGPPRGDDDEHLRPLEPPHPGGGGGFARPDPDGGDDGLRRRGQQALRDGRLGEPGGFRVRRALSGEGAEASDGSGQPRGAVHLRPRGEQALGVGRQRKHDALRVRPAEPGREEDGCRRKRRGAGLRRSGQRHRRARRDPGAAQRDGLRLPEPASGKTSDRSGAQRVYVHHGLSLRRRRALGHGDETRGATRRRRLWTASTGCTGWSRTRGQSSW